MYKAATMSLYGVSESDLVRGRWHNLQKAGERIRRLCERPMKLEDTQYKASI